MKKIVRLNENDLNRLVKKIIKEGSGLKVENDGARVVIKNGKREDVSKFLSNLTEETGVIMIHDCEYADFSGVDLCEFKNMYMLNLKNTPSNFEEKTPSGCWVKENFEGYEIYDKNSIFYSFPEPRISKQINYESLLNMLKSHGETTIKWDEDKQMFMVPIGEYDYYFK